MCFCFVGFHARFSATEVFKVNLYTKPSEAGRFKCLNCSYSTNVKTNLKNHLLTHSKERPYKCDICGIGYIQKKNLLNHKRHHENENILIIK